jgi:UDP-N-acetylmuramoyl-L-alanyl-D-glutamate--2,6-diaminopimelate ligase
MPHTETLARLLPTAPAALAGIALQGIETDTRRLRPGMLYVGLNTRHGDGQQFLQQAWAAGAAAALLESSDEHVHGEQGHPVWQSPQARALLGMALRRWYRWDEGQAPVIVGVTGTNGKSSVTRLIAELAPQPAMIIGTLGYGRVDALISHANTTPDPVPLWQTMATLRDQGAKVIAMEVSSHALALERVAAVPFAAAVFTNLSRDHLDFHGDMLRYGASKTRLFQTPGLRRAVLNGDVAFAGQIAAAGAPEVRQLRFGVESGDYQAVALHPGASGTLLDLRTPAGSRRVRSPLIGNSNVQNLLAALATAEGMGWPVSDAAIAGLDLPEGRYQRLAPVPGKAQVMIDYAHTPDALQRVLTDLREVAKGALTVVFGCGGDRDRGKRPEMGRVSERLADHVILTDDNPRSEAPEAIANDILGGMEQPGRAMVIHDRAAAIQAAITASQAGDWVLIAGKGHERTQEIMGQRQPVPRDRDVATEVLRA